MATLTAPRSGAALAAVDPFRRLDDGGKGAGTERPRPHGGTGSGCTRVDPGSFRPRAHFFAGALERRDAAALAELLAAPLDDLIAAYCAATPGASPAVLGALLRQRPQFFLWAGADLFHTRGSDGAEGMVLLETNSCPSGQKYFPAQRPGSSVGPARGRYDQLVRQVFAPALVRHDLIDGGLAVLYDKNEAETSGYAAALADHFGEPVWLVSLHDGDPAPAARFRAGVLEVRADGGWRPIRAALRYVTQRPWTRLPLDSRTLIVNPLLACLAGGRNKALAARAYASFNERHAAAGLRINLPETTTDVRRHEIPAHVARLGGAAIVKVPYANAGQGVFPVTCPAELDAVMRCERRYDRFVVQALIGHPTWSSRAASGTVVHAGTAANADGERFVADMRMMVGATPDGYRPVGAYGRRARASLGPRGASGPTAWDMVSTNLSIRRGEHSWDSDTERVVVLDEPGLAFMDVPWAQLVCAYVQTSLAMIAIDRLACRLAAAPGGLDVALMREASDDDALLGEIAGLRGPGCP